MFYPPPIMTKKKWQSILILVVMGLTIYNILPTVFYYGKPLSKPLTEAEGQKLASSICHRVQTLEKEALEWVTSYCDLLHVKPQSITLDKTHPQFISVSFIKGEDASVFRSYFPRAGSLIPFIPAQMTLAIQDEHSKTVVIQRHIPFTLSPDHFAFTSRTLSDGSIAPLYRELVLDRAEGISDAIGESDLFEDLSIDWNTNRIILKLRKGISENEMRQPIMDTLARVTELTNESIVPSDEGYAVELSHTPSAQGFLLLDLKPLAEEAKNQVLHTLRTTWNPKHPDLSQENFPIVDEETYASLSPEEQAFCLRVFIPKDRFHSLFVAANGLEKIAESREESTALQQDFARLGMLLQLHGFFPHSNSQNEMRFECSHFYQPLLAATREEFFVHGTHRYALLECINVEERILTENQIESKIHEDLVKWHDEYNAAKISLNPIVRFDVPKPTTSPFWSNFKLNFAKYFRGDDRKILHWGLDLSGGKSVQLELRDHTQTPITQDADLKQGINELYQRLNKMGVAEVSIRQVGNHLSIDFPGSITRSASELIQASSMQFHVVNEKFSPTNPELGESVLRFLQEVWNEAVVTHRTDSDSVEEIAYRHLKEGKSEASALLAKAGLVLAPPSDHSIRSTLDESYSKVAIYRGENQREWHGQANPLLILFRNFALEGANLDNIHASYDPSRGNYLSFDIKGEAQKTLGAWTGKYSKEKVAGTPLEEASRGYGWRMAVVLNNTVISAPTLDSPLQDSAMISGNFSQREVTRLASDLKAGALTYTPYILSEKNVSPELGKSDRFQGILATLCAFLAVVAAMTAYYRFSGVIACVAVLFNLLILWAVLQNLGAALTLAGIAGIILTVAMAVDANVLVFERMKEEFATTGRIATAITAGYKKAYSAIIDSNATTLIAAVILLQFDAGPIKSFAVNLIIGIVSSMFTALFMTQVYFEWWAKNPKNQSLSMANWIGSPNFDFLRHAKKSIALVLALIVIGSGLFLSHRSTLFGMDFTGGISAYLELKNNPSSNAVEEALIAAGATHSDLQIRELASPDHLRLFFSTGMEQLGKPFANLPTKEARIDWVAQALTAANIELAPHGLDKLSSEWTAMSGQMSETMRNQALIGLGLALFAIFAYIAIRFEYPFAMSALLCVAHDALITLGAIAIFHAFGFPLQIDLNTVAALMTIVGYSLNDTIIIFDRIREEGHLRSRSFAHIVNHAINITLSRTAITSGTTLLVLLTLTLLGGASIFSFAFVMMIGVIFGTLSSWFIAAPLLLFFHKREEAFSNT